MRGGREVRSRVTLLLPGRPGDDSEMPQEQISCHRVRVCPVIRGRRRMRCWPRWWHRFATSWPGPAGALEQARAELAQARERIAELEARLRQNPRNSSRPPSSEGLAKPAPRSLRKRSGRKPGGQDGHKGTTLAQVARPDREVRHEPGRCGWCSAGLAGRPVTGVERRQVAGLPPARAEVTEHQLIERECGCGYRTKGRR